MYESSSPHNGPPCNYRVTRTGSEILHLEINVSHIGGYSGKILKSRGSGLGGSDLAPLAMGTSD